MLVYQFRGFLNVIILITLWNYILLKWSRVSLFCCFVTQFLAQFPIFVVVLHSKSLNDNQNQYRKSHYTGQKSFKGPIVKCVRFAFHSNHHKTGFLCLDWQNTLHRVKTQHRTFTEPSHSHLAGPRRPLRTWEPPGPSTTITWNHQHGWWALSLPWEPANLNNHHMWNGVQILVPNRKSRQ